MAAKECLRPPRLRRCPESLAQPTAESQETHGYLLVEGALLDPAVVSKLEHFLRTVWDRWNRRLRGEKTDSAIAYLKGRWGYGKTFYSLYLVRELAPRMGVYARHVFFDDIIEELVKAMRAGHARDPLMLRDLMASLLAGDAPRDKPLVVVLDEFESLVLAHWTGSREERLIVDAFVQLYKDLVNPKLGGLREYKGWMHLVLALTPAASQKLSQILDQAEKSGKLKRRKDTTILILPLPKYTLAHVAERYLRESLGIELEELLGRLAYMNTLYYIAGGSPGVLIMLLNELAKHAVRKCGLPCCICPLSAADIAEALASMELVGPEGETYRPSRELFQSLLHTVTPDVLEALLSLSPLPEGRIPSLGGLLEFEDAILVGPLDESEAAAWIDRAIDEACKGRDEHCFDSARLALQHLINLQDNGTYLLILPSEEGRLEDWLATLGLEVPANVASKLRQLLPRGKMVRKAKVLTPESMLRLYSTPVEAGLQYIVDRGVREKTRRALKVLEDNYPELMNKAHEGLYHVLAWLESDLLPGVRFDESKGLVYTFERRGIQYLIPIEVVAPGEEKVGRTSIAIQISKPEEVQEEWNKVVLHLPPGDLKFLASISIALSLAGEHSLDREKVLDRLGVLETARRVLVDAHNLDDALRRIAEQMMERGIIIEPRAHEETMGDLKKSPVDRFRLLEDVIRYLADLGGLHYPVPLDLLVDTIWNLARNTPYSGRDRKGQWCSLKVPTIGSYSDIKDVNSREEVERLVTKAIVALKIEGLVEEHRVKAPEYKLRYDPITENIRDALEKQERIDYDKHFILPADDYNRGIARYRLELRVELLRRAEKRWDNPAEALGMLKENRIKRRLDEARREQESLNKSLEKLAGIHADGLGLILIVCKKNNCRIIDENSIEGLAQVYARIARRFAKLEGPIYGDGRGLLRKMITLGTGIVSLIKYNILLNKENINLILHKLNTIIYTINQIKLSIAHLNTMGARELALDLKRILEEEERRIRNEIADRAKKAIMEARREVDLVLGDAKKKPRPEILSRFNFHYCDGSPRRDPAIRYSPLYHVLNTLAPSKLDGYLEERLRLLENVKKSLKTIISHMEESGIDIDNEYIQRLHGTEGAITRDRLSMAAGILHIIAGLLESRKDEIRMNQQSRDRALERIPALRSRVQELYNNLHTIDSRLARLEDIMSEHSLGEGIVRDIEDTSRRVREFRNSLQRIEPAIDRVEDACRSASVMNRLQIEQCVSALDEIEESVRSIGQGIERLRGRVDFLERRIRELLLEKAETLLRMARLYHGALLEEVQSGRRELEEAVRRAVDIINRLSNVKGEQGLDTLSRVLAWAEGEWASLVHAEASMGGTAMTLVRLLERIREKGTLPLGELLEMVRSAGFRSVEDALERLARSAERVGLRIEVHVRGFEEA